MTVATLRDVLDPAMQGHSAVAGLVVLGWEDAVAFVAAAEECGLPVILQAGPGCRAFTPLPVIGKMLRYLAEQANVPVVCHLDHSTSIDECCQAIDYGFSSVMFDGSRLPISQNIDMTARLAGIAHAAHVSVEGEVGFVGYDKGQTSSVTDIEEVARYDRGSGADAIAISIGNVHLQQVAEAVIDWAHLKAIEQVTHSPLVLHGASGIAEADRRKLATQTRICKFNVGTELRMAFGAGLRQSLADQPKEFDRIKVMRPMMDHVRKSTVRLLQSLV